MLERKKILRTIITITLFFALGAVLVFSQNSDPGNPHKSVDRDVWINGPNGHGYAVMNNQQPWKQCYPCHEEKGLGGESYCMSCHEESGIKIDLPKQF